MARLDARHAAGAPGPWFVDDRCIDCDAARHVAPGLIERNPGDGVSYFVRQPETDAEIEMAWRAVLVCPTRSVGHATERRPPNRVFPQPLGGDVYRLGHNSRDSFGAHSYLAVRPAERGGNLMIDAPRWTREVAGPLAEMGGVEHILLSHRDDVADAERYAEEFGARVWIHTDDASAAPYATDLLTGADPTEIVPGVIAFPVPGHTKGSVLYYIDGHLLFSGDSLAWNPRAGELMAFRRACWYSWEAQTESLRRFSASGLSFDRLFCGHGWSQDAADLSPPQPNFDDRLAALVDRMPSQ